MRRRLVVAMVGPAALVGVMTGCNPLTGIQQVATGGAHACALHTDGTAHVTIVSSHRSRNRNRAADSPTGKCPA